MIAVFPGNIQMAVDAGAPKNVRAVGAWARLPLQAPLLAWGVRITRPPPVTVTVTAPAT